MAFLEVINKFFVSVDTAKNFGLQILTDGETDIAVDHLTIPANNHPIL
jgi:hypothetical protein